MTMPNFRLDQQTALVTGAASGIGRGIALGLAAAGAKVACFDLPESALEEVCDEIRMAGSMRSPYRAMSWMPTCWPMRYGTRRGSSARSAWLSIVPESPTLRRQRRCR